MNIAKCRLCGKKIPIYYYANALFCGDYCRKKYYDIRKGRSKPEQALNELKGVGNEVFRYDTEK